MNDVQRAYNTFEQPITEFQEHNGAVNTLTSPNVQFQYADGSANTIRPTALIYPNGRVLNYSSGAAGGIDDALSRVASLIDNDGITHLADYTRIGADTFVQQSSPQPQIAWSLINGAGIDPYTGLDQFGRVVDNRWFSTATNADLDRLKYGYDRASNPVWHKNTVAAAEGVYLDELYNHDGVYRISEMQRGELNGSNTGIVAGTLSFAQAWGLDATGNWQQFWQNSTGSAWDLQQSRSANKINQITAITGGGWTLPAYDAAGNTVQMPAPSSPATANGATYDAWNRMMSVSSGGSELLRNAYDGDDRRVTMLVSGTMRHYYFSGSCQPAEERIGSASSADRQFVFGLRFAGDLVLRDRGAERFYALQDASATVGAICSAIGAVEERYLYAPYGSPTFLTPSFSTETGSAYDWETLFHDFTFDSQAGLYLACGSHLSSLLGFWLTQALGDDGSGSNGVNLYEFHNGTPPKRTPPPKEPVPPPIQTAHGDPNRQCEMELCCGALTVGGVLATCPNGTVPCHCFIRVSQPKHKPREYHGVSIFVPTSNCPNCLVLTCDKDLKRAPLRTVLGPIDCITLGFFNCQNLLDCLNDETDDCEKSARCYNKNCGSPNSNTVAFDYVESCGGFLQGDLPDLEKYLPVVGTGCNSVPVAPGWG